MSNPFLVNVPYQVSLLAKSKCPTRVDTKVLYTARRQVTQMEIYIFSSISKPMVFISMPIMFLI